MSTHTVEDVLTDVFEEARTVGADEVRLESITKPDEETPVVFFTFLNPTTEADTFPIVLSATELQTLRTAADADSDTALLDETFSVPSR